MPFTILNRIVLNNRTMDSYNDIVSEWFLELQVPFVNYIRGKFSAISYEDAMDLYSETYFDIYNNLLKGNIKADTKWASYIFTIGFRKAIRKVGKGVNFVDINDPKFNGSLRNGEGNEYGGYQKEDSDDQDKSKEVLVEQIKYIPEPCHSVLLLFYYEKMSMNDIALAMHYKNSQTAKAKKNQCLNKLKARVKMAFKLAGIEK